MASVRMVLVYAHKDGMEDTVHSVSIYSFRSIKYFYSYNFYFRAHYWIKLNVFGTAGCVNGCSRHGSCILLDGEYTCQCSDGWAGIDCSVRLEMDCTDEMDNDQG